LIAAGGEPAGIASVVAVFDRWWWRHDVSILITAGADVGQCLGWQPRSKVSMMIMRAPQQGHGCSGVGGLAIADDPVGGGGEANSPVFRPSG
jgi:hypothetical protein